ncbi:allantoinase [Nitratireductor aestuarii]|uniref:Allantoinase n=1 Tax=Nitratireductor aestuarii TaxID=1735103 RepID=A0A916S1B3_9HYPH|nr:dihydroorotase family protein [Nitratireductor aestuarii]GGA79160.1 allantoinase [Nitratireductor aestuarii]
MAFNAVLRGDIVLTHEIVTDGYIGIKDGTIAAIGRGIPEGDAPVYDYTGDLIFPGLIDAQVHAGSIDGVAGLADATRAAAAGGVTTIVDMPFDNPLPVDNLDAFSSKIERIGEHAFVDVALYVTAPKGGRANAITQLVEAGACAVKLSTYEYHPTRFPRSTMGEMYQVFTEAAPLDIPIAFHNEDQEIVTSLTAAVLAEGRTGPETHALTRPPIAEMVANAQVLELGLRTGARTHIVHSSIIEGFDMIDRYRALGGRVSAETCLQYLIFNEDDVVREGSSMKQTPPLRSEEQRLALWEALAEGEIEIISTDHVAWPLSRKSDPDMFKNSSGVPGLEALLPILYTELVQRDLSPTIIAQVCGINVARHFAFEGRKGSIRVGADADFAILRKGDGIFDASRMVSAEKWSPYHGRRTAGHVAATYLRGQLIFSEGKVAEGHRGTFVKPERKAAGL